MMSDDDNTKNKEEKLDCDIIIYNLVIILHHDTETEGDTLTKLFRC